jgi:broad specificity phosphatase PhoE
MINVYLVRHGETDLNALHVVQGRIDTHGLNDTGRAQTRKLIEAVKAKGLRADAVLSSPLKRAAETAEPLAAHFGVPVRTDRGLEEMFFGDCDGITVKELRALAFNPPLSFRAPDGAVMTVADGNTLRAYHASTDPLYDNLAHPGGETKAEARDRAVKAVLSVLKENPGLRDLWVVGHGAVLRFITGKFTPKDQHIEGGVKNASILHYMWDAATPETLAWQGVLHAPDGALGI